MQRAWIVLCGEISGMGKECVGSRTWRKVERLQGSVHTRPESVSVDSECLKSDILSLYRPEADADKDELTASSQVVTSCPPGDRELHTRPEPEPVKSGHFIHN